MGYSTGNTCYYDGDYITHFKQMAEQGWSVSDWVLHGSHLDSWVTCENTCCGSNGNGGFGEEFWNCADIAVLPSGQSQGGATTEAPMATTTSQVSLTTAMPTTTPTPTESPQGSGDCA